MRLLTTCFAITFAILLSACSTTGPKYHTIKDSTPQLESEKGRIYFYRNSGFVGGGLRPNIRLNDEIVGESKPGGFFFVDRKPGDMKVATATDS